MARLRFLLLLALLPAALFAQASLDAVAAALTEENHIFGPDVEGDDLAGRVVVIWGLTDLVERTKGQYSDEEGNANRNRNNNRRNRQKDENGEEILSEEDKLRKDYATLMKTAKKSKSLLIVGALKLADSPTERKRQITTVRALRPHFPVYNLSGDSAIYDALGNSRASVKNIADIAESDRLTNAIDEAPEYVKGRIIRFKTEASEAISKRFVVGQNLEKMTARLRTTAQGSDVRAEDARKMLEAIDAYIEGQCAAIESELAATPSRAIGRITRFSKTFPTAARKYQGMLNTLRNSREVKLFLNINAFLKKAANGDVGSGDMGRKADGFTKNLQQLTASKNPAIAAEANTLLTLLEPYSTASLTAERDAERARDREERQAREERESENRRNRNGRRGNEDEGPRVKNDTDAYSYLLASGPVGSFEVFKDELDGLDHSTCNYEALKVAYTKYENTKGDKTEAARNLIATIDAMSKALRDEVNSLQKLPLSVHLTRDRNKTIGDAVIAYDYEVLLSTNFPSIQNTPPGRNLLKMYRDAEVKRIADAILDYESKEEKQTEWREGETAGDRKAKSIQTKIAKLKGLQKYRRTATPLGKLCVAQLDQMGYTDEGIENMIKDEQENLKSAKQAAKEEEERQKEQRKSWR